MLNWIFVLIPCVEYFRICSWSFAFPKAPPLDVSKMSPSVITHLFLWKYTHTLPHQLAQKINNKFCAWVRQPEKIHKHFEESAPLPPYCLCPTPTDCSHNQSTLTGSGVPDRSRSLTVSGKPEDSCGLCTSEGYCVILILSIGKPGSQPSAPTQTQGHA